MKRRYRFFLPLAAAVVTLAACNARGSSPGPTPAPFVLDPANTAVLVVDDFGFSRTPVKLRWTRTENCAVATNEVGSGGAGDEPPPPPYKHGEVVYRALKEQLSLPAYHLTLGTSETTPGATHNVETVTNWTYLANGAPYAVRLQAVHTAGYKTADIIAGLQQTIATLRRGEEAGSVKFTRFVVNLSFVVIPCDVGSWLAKGDADLVSSYQALITDKSLRQFLSDKGYLDLGTNTFSNLAPPGTSVTQGVLTNDDLAGLRIATVSAFYTAPNLSFNEGALGQISHDPAWKAFTANPSGENGAPPVRVVPVGAAGNGVWYVPDAKSAPVRKTLKFPFAPALWETVVSVSAGTGGTPSDYSNWGEVTQDGQGPTIATNTHGTSYAAPRVGGQETFYLLRGGPVLCDHSGPPLKYVTNIAAGGWANLDWPAWDGKCYNFMKYATDSP